MGAVIDLIIAALVLLILITIWWYASIPSNLPPGPLGLPILGSTLQTWRSSTAPKQLCEWAKKYGSVYKIYVGSKLVVVLGDWNAIQEALVKQGDNYAGRPLLNVIVPKEVVKSGLVNSEGELWKIQRRFALSTLRDFGFGRPIIEPRIKDEAEYLLETIENCKNRPFDPAPFLSNAVANVISALTFGKRFQYEDENFHRLLRVLRSRFNESDNSILTPFVFSKTVATVMSQLPEIKRSQYNHTELIAFVRSQIAETLKNFRSDFDDEPSNYIEAFYKAQKNKDENWTFTDEQLLATVTNLFVAGTVTTATTLRWAVFFLAHHPDVQERVYEEIRKETGTQSLLNYADRTKLPFTEATIMETQRLGNLIPLGVMRRTLGPSKLFGYDIPAGTAVVPLLTAVLHDSKIYPNPEHFDPNRFLNASKEGKKADVFTQLIPFQVGKRICLGESLAKMELFILFTALVSRYKFYFPPEEPKPPQKAQVSRFCAPVPFKICAQRRTD